MGSLTTKDKREQRSLLGKHVYDTLKECAVISKYARGIEVFVHNIRATSSYIRGTNGTSNDIIPMLRVFNDTARYVDKGGGKRKGAFAVYLEPWHADVLEFLDLRKNHADAVSIHLYRRVNLMQSIGEQGNKQAKLEFKLRSKGT